ncbi:MAG: DUF1013 domain-containing protein [Rhodospirillaceae bacterium]|nr:DUF1013 domain-containing protein [Rhodospirillaceae bacterium]
MALPLMPKATAVWLVDNTTLTFTQIAEFTGMHELEVQAIADEEVAIGIVGVDPTTNGQLSTGEIKKGEEKPGYKLKLSSSDIPKPKARSKGARYTPVSKRQERPDAIAWLLRHHPELADAQVSGLLGTTKPTINSIRERTHWNMQNIKPQNPVTLGLCNEPDLQKALALAARRAKKAGIDLPKRATEVDQPSENNKKVSEDIPAATPASSEITAEELFRPTSTES